MKLSSHSKPKFFKSFLAAFLLLTIISLPFFISCTRVIKESDLFYPRKYKPISDTLQRKNVSFKIKDGPTLRGWWLHSPQHRQAMICFYGNGETLIHSETRLYWMAATLKCNILAFDYRGYGFSDGYPSFRAIFKDALAQYDYMVEHLTPPDMPLFVFGYSIGTVFATKLATERKIDGLILMAPMTSASETVRALENQLPWFVRWFICLKPADSLLKNDLQPITMIIRVHSPLLFIHGSRDQLIPIKMGKQLFDKAPATQKYFCEVKEASHNDLDVSSPPISETLKHFFKNYGMTP